MEKVRIVHCADLHFDTPFSDLKSSLSKIRQEEIRETFSRIIEICKDENADILLICGDVFDNYSVKKITLQFLKEKFEEISNVRVFIVAGNHDPLNERSFYKMVDWPSNVHIFSNTMEEVQINDINVTVIGQSFKNNYEKVSQLDNYFPGNSENDIRIMMMHGEVTDIESSNEYNPVKEKEIEKSRVSYLALGHRHSFSGFKKCGMTTYAYSGCPEGRGFDELGDKGIIVGDVYKDHVDLKFVPICKRKYQVIKVDISGLMSNDSIKSKILSKTYDNCSNDIYKVILEGEVSDEFIINTDIIMNSIKSYFFDVKVKDKTTVKVDIKKLSKEYSIRGIFSAKMLKKIEEAASEEEKECLINALKIGLQSLSMQEVE